MAFLVASRYCNALIESAEPDLSIVSLGHLLTGTNDSSEVTEVVLAGMKKLYGGLWVGGKVTLTTQALTFRPNAMNAVFNQGDLDIRVLLSGVSSTSVLPGFLTKIVTVSYGDVVVKLRCFGATSFRKALDGAVVAAKRGTS